MKSEDVYIYATACIIYQCIDTIPPVRLDETLFADRRSLCQLVNFTVMSAPVVAFSSYTDCRNTGSEPSGDGSLLMFRNKHLEVQCGSIEDKT